MAIKRLGAQRFSGLEEDVNNLPLDADLTGAIFNSTDTLLFWIFNGTSWNPSAGGGGITGLEPNSTILEYTTDILDYTTPTSATATSGTPANAIDGNTTTFWASTAGINESITVDMGSAQNCYGLAYYIDKVASGITETQFQIKSAVGLSLVDNLLTYYNFEQTSGDLLDQSGNVGSAESLGDDAVNTSVTQTFTGKIGNAYDYNGSTSRSVINNSLASVLNFDGTLPFSIGFWYASTQGTPGQFIGNWDGNGWGIYMSNDSGIALRLANTLTTNSIRVSLADANIDDGNYHYLVVTYDGSQDANGVKMYFDNVDKSLTVTENTLTLSTVSSIPVEIGSRNGGTDQFYNGSLDELVIYDIAINATQVNDLWNGGNGKVPSTQVGPTLRTVSVADLTDQSYNFIRFNGVNARFLIIEGSSGSSLVMAANELAVQVEADPPLTTKHGQFTINGTDIALPLNGGDPTSSVIDDPIINTLTLNNVATPNDPASGKAVLWVETVDGNNDGVFAKIKIDGSFQTVRVI